MKRIVSILALLLSASAYGQGPNIQPNEYAAGLSSTDGVNWSAITSTATVGPYQPNAYVGLLGYNSSTLQWYPCSTTNPCAGVGSGGGSAGVSSFNARTGAVTPMANDYSLNQLSGLGSASALAAVAGTPSNSTAAAVIPGPCLHTTTGEDACPLGQTNPALGSFTNLKATGTLMDVGTVATGGYTPNVTQSFATMATDATPVFNTMFGGYNLTGANPVTAILYTSQNPYLSVINSNDNLGFGVGETYNAGFLNLTNISSSGKGVIGGGSAAAPTSRSFLYIDSAGYVCSLATGGTPGYVIGSGSAPSVKNCIDNGSGVAFFGSILNTPISGSTGSFTTSTSSGASTGSNIKAGENVVTFSATPTFSNAFQSNYIVLTANVTSFTLAAGSAGQQMCLMFKHDATATAYTVAAPANVHGFFTVGTTASKLSQQCYTYSVADTAWEAQAVGVINE